MTTTQNTENKTKYMSFQLDLTALNGRGVKRGKRNEAIRVQDECYRYWELGCNKSAIVNATNAKVTYSDVFEYYKREFSALGVRSADELELQLRRRRKRISNRSRRGS